MLIGLISNKYDDAQSTIVVEKSEGLAQGPPALQGLQRLLIF